MRVLGVRAEPNSINWAVVEGTTAQPVLVQADNSAAPSSYDEAACLAWYRDRILLVIDQLQVDRVAVRYPEPVSGRAGTRVAIQDSNRRRCRVEGVVLEAAHSRSKRVVVGALTTISSSLGTKSAKKYLNDDDLRGLDWSRYRQKNLREAILVAAAALPN